MRAEAEPKLVDPSARRRRLRELAVVYGASALLTAGLVLLGQVVPLIGQNVLALVALVFLYLPIAALRRRGLEPADFGLDRALLVRGARLGLLLTVLTIPPFLLGFHLWQTVVFEQRLDPALDNYRTLPDSLRVAPPAAREAGLYLWRRHRHLIVQWEGPGPWVLTVESDGQLQHRGGALPTELATETETETGPEGLGGAWRGTRWRIHRASGGGELVLTARGGRSVVLTVERGGAPLPPEEVWSGGAFGTLDETRPLVLERSWLWIPLSLLVQLLLVALPEEFFYRGYLQTRLDGLDPRRFHFGPFHTSPAILITSLLFALGHFIIGFDPVRLAVFFPSLVFGWLRDRSGGLGASIVYHAACNLMVELTIVHYWPV
jgi:membrane protease YdiL (CAAX protease family)